jgi:hypothetical protein
VVQGIAQSPTYTVHIAGRSAMLRVFVSLDGADSVDGVSARVRHYARGQPHGELASPAQTIFATSSPGDLTHTFNFNLPANWLTSDSAYVVELDNANELAEIDETNNRYPAAGEQSFGFVPVPTLEVVIVPVRYKGILPPLDDLSYLTWMPERVLPVAHIDYSVRATPYVFEGDLGTSTGWGELLAAIDGVRAAEGGYDGRRRLLRRLLHRPGLRQYAHPHRLQDRDRLRRVRDQSPGGQRDVRARVGSQLWPAPRTLRRATQRGPGLPLC